MFVEYFYLLMLCVDRVVVVYEDGRVCGVVVAVYVVETAYDAYNGIGTHFKISLER